MGFADRSRRRHAHIRNTLGTNEVCSRCHATLDNYDTTCTAALEEKCPGFLTVEQAINKAKAEGC
jgi:hypothetical protein